MGRDRRKPVTGLILELVLLVIAYVLERHLLGPLRGQAFPGAGVGFPWLEGAAWVLVAAGSLLLAGAVLVRARGDLGTSLLVGVVGLVAWAIFPLGYTGCWQHPCMSMNPPVMAALNGDVDSEWRGAR